jgi:uncharacterized protein (DUF362 family)
MSNITRRKFLRISGTATLGAALAEISGWPASMRPGSATRVALAKGRNYERLLATALESLGGASCLARPGDQVVLKPTAAWNRPPHLAANTNPFVVQALARLCLEAGARTVTVFDRTSFRADLCYNVCGLTGALAQLRAPQIRLVTLTDADFIKEPGGEARFCRWTFETDRFINVPKAKHHTQRGLALGGSNLLGVVGGGAPLQDEFLVRTMQCVRPALTILDATRVLVRNGPAGGSESDVEVRDSLVVGRDPLAVDALACGFFGRHWQEFPYLQLAAQAGLGEPDLRKVKVREVS